MMLPITASAGTEAAAQQAEAPICPPSRCRKSPSLKAPPRSFRSEGLRDSSAEFQSFNTRESRIFAPMKGYDEPEFLSAIRGSYLRNYTYRFIELCSPALSQAAVQMAVLSESAKHIRGVGPGPPKTAGGGRSSVATSGHLPSPRFLVTIKAVWERPRQHRGSVR